MANPFESASDVPIDSQPLVESGDDEDDMKSAVEEHEREDGHLVERYRKADSISSPIEIPSVRASRGVLVPIGPSSSMTTD